MDTESHSAAAVRGQPAVWDDLTGLPARPLLREHARVALSRAREDDREVALLQVGLDDFKLVNDSLGHEAGDEVLRRVGLRLRDRLRETNVVARPGGDRFCVLVPDLGDREEVVDIVVGQVMVAVQEPLEVDGARFELGASVGVSVFPADAEDVDGLLEHADAAMYEAKSTGRGSYVVYAGGTHEKLERLMLTARLREALEHERFVLHYQPIVALPEGRVVAVEALLRWADPARGLIAPMDFIPVAEYTGLIDPIGEWVLAQGCAQAAAWRDQGLELPVSVNVSLRQFQATGFADTLRAHLAGTGVDPSLLLVEITESTAMRDPACVEPVLRELREAGVRIAIDDFGTGYSSLGRLQHMPVEMLKIDRGFLAAVPGDAEGSRIAGAMVDLMHALGKVAVAEGVETPEQRRFLEQHGCPLAQGFHFGRPVPADEVAALVRRAR